MPQLFSRVIPALNSKNKKHWKERVEVANAITKLCESHVDDQFLKTNYQRIVEALKKAKAGVKAVREACQIAIDALTETNAAFNNNKNSNNDNDVEEDNLNNVDFHELTDVPPIKFEENEPQLDVDFDADEEEDEGENDDGDDNVVSKKLKTKKKKYAYQRKPGGLRSPRNQQTASGSGTATVRLLKELGNKSVAMQRSLDDLTNATRTIRQNVKEIEVEVRAPSRKSQELERKAVEEKQLEIIRQQQVS